MKKKFFIITLIFTFILSCSAFIVGFVPERAMAAEGDLIKMTGAATRIKSPYGLRFEAEIKEEDANSAKSLGMYICPTDLLQNGAFPATINASNLVPENGTPDTTRFIRKVEIPKNTLEAGETGKKLARVSLVNIQTHNIDRKFSAMAYVIKNDNSEVKSAPITRSISYVARLAQEANDPATGEGRTFINGIVLNSNDFFICTKGMDIDNKVKKTGDFSHKAALSGTAKDIAFSLGEKFEKDVICTVSLYAKASAAGITLKGKAVPTGAFAELTFDDVTIGADHKVTLQAAGTGSLWLDDIRAVGMNSLGTEKIQADNTNGGASTVTRNADGTVDYNAGANDNTKAGFKPGKTVPAGQYLVMKFKYNADMDGEGKYFGDNSYEKEGLHIKGKGNAANTCRHEFAIFAADGFKDYTLYARQSGDVSYEGNKTADPCGSLHGTKEVSTAAGTWYYAVAPAPGNYTSLGSPNKYLHIQIADIYAVSESVKNRLFTAKNYPVKLRTPTSVVEIYRSNEYDLKGEITKLSLNIDPTKLTLAINTTASGSRIYLTQGKVIANLVGVAQVTVDYPNETQKTVMFRIIKSTVTFDTKLLIETARPEKSFDVSGIQMKGTVSSVKIGTRDVNIYASTDEGGKIVMNESAPVAYTDMGENLDITIDTEQSTYKGKADVYTMVIRNKADLEAMTAASEDAAKKDAYAQGYFIQDADIDFGDPETVFKGFGKYVNGSGWTAPFTGVFDGKGHMISDYVAVDAAGGVNNSGLFACLKGTVKNLIVYHVKQRGCGGVITTALDGGKIENVMVYGTIEHGAVWAPGSLVASKVYANASMNNVLAFYYNPMRGELYKSTWFSMKTNNDVDINPVRQGIIAGTNWGTDNLSNCVAVNLDEHFPGDLSAVGTDEKDASNNPTVRGRVRNWGYANTDKVKTFKGMGEYNAFKATSPAMLNWTAPFNQKLTFVDLDYDLKNGTNDLTVTLPFSDVSQITLIDVTEGHVTLSKGYYMNFNYDTGNGKTYTASGSQLTIPYADLSAAHNHVLKVESQSGAIYHANIAVFRSISTAAELNALSTYHDAGIRYFRQTADIDYNGGDIKTGLGEKASDEWNKEFHGIYNGMGHSISNGTIANNSNGTYPSSVFGCICGDKVDDKYESGGIVENMVFANITVPNASAIVANANYHGIIRNIVAHGTLTGNGQIVNKDHVASLIVDRTSWGSRVYNIFAIAKKVSLPSTGYGGLIIGWNKYNAGNGAYIGRLVAVNLDTSANYMRAISNDGADNGHATIAANSASDTWYDENHGTVTDRANPGNVKTFQGQSAFDTWRSGADYNYIAEWAFNYGYIDKLQSCLQS